LAQGIRAATDDLTKQLYLQVKGPGQVSLANTNQREDIQELSDSVITSLMTELNHRLVFHDTTG